MPMVIVVDTSIKPGALPDSHDAAAEPIKTEIARISLTRTLDVPSMPKPLATMMRLDHMASGLGGAS